MPTLMTPWVDGCVPVRMVAREGWQYGFWQRQAVYFVPLAASESRFGVWQISLP